MAYVWPCALCGEMAERPCPWCGAWLCAGCEKAHRCTGKGQ